MPSFSWEPAYGTVHLLYRHEGRTVHITDRTCAFGDSVHRSFDYRLYGSNLAYVEFDRERVSLFRFHVYSERNGKVLVDYDFSRYWKVVANDTGIICHRYREGQERVDPAPMVYSAHYLKSF